jgi:hypothetical protein
MTPLRYDITPALNGCRPSKDQDVSSWGAENVCLIDSPIGTKFSPDVGRYSIAPLEDLRDPEVFEINVVGCTGMGKTTIFEVASCWVVAEAPGPTLLIGTTNKTVQDWMESRMLKVFDKCEPTAQLLPTGRRRFDKKKTGIIFRHMAYFTGGANETNTQEKSIRYTFGDEPWEWPNGIIGHLLKRHHDRWNRKSLLQSQGGNMGSEWHDHCKHGQQMVRHFTCPTCKERHPWSWKLHSWEAVKDEAGDYDWIAIGESVRFTCPCGAEFADTPQNRRTLADSGEWVAELGAFVPGRKTYSVPFFWVWRIEWAAVVKDWILAQDAKRAGDFEPLKQVINKRFAQFWEEPSDVPELRTDGDPYSKADYHKGEKWEDEAFRFMTIDVQKGHFWAVVRAWKLGGDSRLIWEGKLETWENIVHTQDRLEVQNRCVFIDCGYLPDEVAKMRALNRKKVGEGQNGEPVWEMWNMLMGEDSQGYPVKVRQSTMWRNYSNWVNRQSQERIPYRYSKFSNLRAKDQLAALMSGKGAGFGVPVDHSKSYAKQMQNEQKKEVSPGKWRWVPVTAKANNHLWDCEVMGIVAACIYKVLRGLTDSGE